MALNKAASLLIIDLINLNAAPKVFTAADIEFGTPEVMAAGYARNTAVALKPKGTSGKLSSATRVFYDRVNFADLQDGTPLSIVDGGFLTVEDLVDELNTEYGIVLTADDVDFDQDVSEGAYPRTIEIPALANSLGYLGSLDVVINQPA